VGNSDSVAGVEFLALRWVCAAANRRTAGDSPECQDEAAIKLRPHFGATRDQAIRKGSAVLKEFFRASLAQ
jgi:hypothetical protein